MSKYFYLFFQYGIPFLNKYNIGFPNGGVRYFLRNIHRYLLVVPGGGMHYSRVFN